MSHTGENSLRGGEGGGQGAREESEKEGEGRESGGDQTFLSQSLSNGFVLAR